MRLVKNFLAVVGGAVVSVIAVGMALLAYENFAPRVIGRLKKAGIIPLTEEDFYQDDEFYRDFNDDAEDGYFTLGDDDLDDDDEDDDFDEDLDDDKFDDTEDDTPAGHA